MKVFACEKDEKWQIITRRICPGDKNTQEGFHNEVLAEQWTAEVWTAEQILRGSPTHHDNEAILDTYLFIKCKNVEIKTQLREL